MGLHWGRSWAAPSQCGPPKHLNLNRSPWVLDSVGFLASWAHAHQTWERHKFVGRKNVPCQVPRPFLFGGPASRQNPHTCRRFSVSAPRPTSPIIPNFSFLGGRGLHPRPCPRFVRGSQPQSPQLWFCLGRLHLVFSALR